MTMAKGKRVNRIVFLLTDEELSEVKEKMAQLGISNASAYLRKMAIDGYHINIDLTDVREMVRLLSNATNNMNQIARRANETHNIYATDIEDLQRQYDSLWGAANKILTGLAKIK